MVAKSLDLLRASAAASTRLFVVDVLGSCGYNCVMGGIAGKLEGDNYVHILFYFISFFIFIFIFVFIFIFIFILLLLLLFLIIH